MIRYSWHPINWTWISSVGKLAKHQIGHPAIFSWSAQSMANHHVSQHWNNRFALRHIWLAHKWLYVTPTMKLKASECGTLIVSLQTNHFVRLIVCFSVSRIIWSLVVIVTYLAPCCAKTMLSKPVPHLWICFELIYLAHGIDRYTESEIFTDLFINVAIYLHSFFNQSNMWSGDWFRWTAIFP